MADVKVIPVKAKNGLKTYYTLEWGKAKGQRKATGIYTWTNPTDKVQKNFNKEQLAILSIKAAQLTVTSNAVGTRYVPEHRFKANFIDYFADFVLKNEKSQINRSMSCCLEKFKEFLIKKEKCFTISPYDITHNLCERFQVFLLDNLTGETPGDYFMRFKRILKSATKDGYYTVSPAEDIPIKQHESAIKDVLEADEYKRLLNSHCSNNEVRKAAIVSMYTGLRWCDIDLYGWQIKKDAIVLKKQSKTGVPLEVPLHPVARAVIGDIHDPTKKIFDLPTADGANKCLKQWVKNAGIDKHITWHCLRHSVSHIMQAAGVDVTTVSQFLGQKSAKYVLKTYTRRVAASNMRDAASILPS